MVVGGLVKSSDAEGQSVVASGARGVRLNLAEGRILTSGKGEDGGALCLLCACAEKVGEAIGPCL